MAVKYPISRAHDKHITTIEVIGTIANSHPLQVAFATSGAIQYSFCAPGMIVRATALRDKNLSPSREEITNATNPISAGARDVRRS
ncbi:MAG: 2Fe-2S iron-sulfur cluster-binding protein [Syntrophorhabdales bacterium]